MSSAHRRQITSETCTLAGMLSSFFGSVLAIVSNTPRAGAAHFTSLNGTSAGGPTHVGLDASKVSLVPENPRRVAPRLPTNVRSRTQVQTQTIRIGGEIHRAFSRRSEAPWNGNPIMT